MYKMLLHILAYVYKYQPQKFDELLAAIAKYHSRLISVQGHVGKVESTMREAKTLQASLNLQAKAKEKQVDLALKEAKIYITQKRPKMSSQTPEKLIDADRNIASSLRQKLANVNLTSGVIWQALISSVVGVDALVAVLSYISSYSNEFAIDEKSVQSYKNSAEIAQLFQKLRNDTTLSDTIIDYLVYRQLVKFSNVAIDTGGDYSEAYVVLVNVIDALDKDQALVFGSDALYRLVAETNLDEMESEEDFITLATAHYERLQAEKEQSKDASITQSVREDQSKKEKIFLGQRISLNESDIANLREDASKHVAEDAMKISTLESRLKKMEEKYKNLLQEKEERSMRCSQVVDESQIFKDLQQEFQKVTYERNKRLTDLEFLRTFYGRSISEIGRACKILKQYEGLLIEEGEKNE